MEHETEYVQPRRRVDGQIALAEPDPSWPAMYAEQEHRIRGALGGRALRVEHVGSTSVAGLPAKPVIDIALVVSDPAHESAYLPDLEKAGYVLHLREPGWQEHRLLRWTGRGVNLHVFGPGSAEVERMVRFRDWLRDHPEDRELYERRKRELGARTWAYVQDYADAKTGVVEDILRRSGGPAG